MTAQKPKEIQLSGEFTVNVQQPTTTVVEVVSQQAPQTVVEVVSQQVVQAPQQIVVTETGGDRSTSELKSQTTTIVDLPGGMAPKFVKPIQPCVITEGQSCVFSAIFSGEPPPTVEWLREKEPLMLTERHSTAFDVNEGTCALTIANCQQADTGVYSCRASNTAGRATCTANVVVVRE